MIALFVLKRESKCLHENRVEKPQTIEGSFLRFRGKKWGDGERPSGG